MKQQSNRQKTIEDIGGGLHPAVDGQNLGQMERIKTQTEGKIYKEISLFSQ